MEQNVPMLNGLKQITLDGTVKILYRMIGEMMNYKFNEGQLIQELKEYIDGTYGEHYASDKYQATDIIIAVSYTHLTLPTKRIV